MASKNPKGSLLRIMLAAIALIEREGAGQWRAVAERVCANMGLVCDDVAAAAVYNCGYYGKFWSQSPITMEGGIIALKQATDAQRKGAEVLKLSAKEQLAAVVAELEALKAKVAASAPEPPKEQLAAPKAAR